MQKSAKKTDLRRKIAKAYLVEMNAKALNVFDVLKFAIVEPAAYLIDLADFTDDNFPESNFTESLRAEAANIGILLEQSTAEESGTNAQASPRDKVKESPRLSRLYDVFDKFAQHSGKDSRRTQIRKVLSEQYLALLESNDQDIFDAVSYSIKDTNSFLAELSDFINEHYPNSVFSQEIKELIS